MSSRPRFCPQCGAPQLPGATRCRACDHPLASLAAAPAGAPAPPGTPAVSAEVPAFDPPTAEAWPVMWGLIGLCAAGVAASNVLGHPEPGYGLILVGITLLLTQLILWASGRANARAGVAFLRSDRPLVRWVYTPEEWQQVRSYFYEEARSDGPPLGCLPVLFGLSGLLAGLMVGAEDGLGSALLGALIGTAIGAVVGGVLVLPVLLINRVVADRALRAEAPATVALGAHELFYERVYFDTRIHRLETIQIATDAPPRLLIDRYAHRVSPANHFPGVILVPPRMLPAVQEVLHRIETGGSSGALAQRSSS